LKEYTQEEIDFLIGCEKEITEPPRKEMKIESGSKRNGMRLKAKEHDLEFSIFMRINVDFPENFSIGLEYLPKDERDNLMLIRCNGPHGEFKGAPEPSSTHFLYHIHKAKSENIRKNLRPEKYGEPTKEYGSYAQALSYFFKLVNVINAWEYFEDLDQLKFEWKGED